jgi:VWFA-related protein
MGMFCLNLWTLKDRCFRTAVLGVICGPLLATLCLVMAQTSNPEKSDAGQKKVAFIIHTTDQSGNPVAPSTVKDVQVMGHGRQLQVVDGPKSAGPKQFVLLIDSNFHQRKVLPLEQQTAAELLSEFEKERAQALVMSYGAEIHSSGELTDDFGKLKNFTSSLRVENDKRNETVLLYDTMKRAIEKSSDGPGTKAVVVFAEGNDHGSPVAWRSLPRMAQRDHVACYVVLFADHSFYGREVRHYGYYLVELAPKTGGRLWEVGDNPRKAHEAAQQLALALDSQALIEVLVPNVQANRFHPVKVTSPGYRVSAQTGYFDNGKQ